MRERNIDRFFEFETQDGFRWNSYCLAASHRLKSGSSARACARAYRSARGSAGHRADNSSEHSSPADEFRRPSVLTHSLFTFSCDVAGIQVVVFSGHVDRREIDHYLGLTFDLALAPAIARTTSVASEPFGITTPPSAPITSRTMTAGKLIPA